MIIKTDIKTKFLAYLKLANIRPNEFADSIKRDRTTLYRFLNNRKKNKDHYIDYKVNEFINKVEQELKEYLL